MDELEKIRALFNSGEENNIKLGLTLCETLPESEPLLQRYREFVGLYPDLFGESPEFWMQIQTVANSDGISLSLEHLEAYAGLFASLESLTILVETDEAEIRLSDILVLCPRLERLGIQSTRRELAKIAFHAPATPENRTKIGYLFLINVHLTHALAPSFFEHLRELYCVDCAFSERFDWVLGFKQLQIVTAIKSGTPGDRRVAYEDCPAPSLWSLSATIELLPMFPAMPALQRLWVADVRSEHNLAALPQQFPNLRELQIYQNLETSVRLDLRKVLPELPQLEILELGGMDTEPYGMVLLPFDFSALKRLHSFLVFNLHRPGGWEVLGRIPTLERVIVQNCQIDALPDNWANLTRMKSLVASDNKIEVLPDWIGNWTSLERLYLDSNRLTSLPGSLWPLLEDPNREIDFEFGGNQLDPETKARLRSI